MPISTGSSSRNPSSSSSGAYLQDKDKKRPTAIAWPLAGRVTGGGIIVAGSLMPTPRGDTPAPHCRRCPRLVALRRRVRRAYPTYHAGPVVAIGPGDARLLVVGLAPGMHGANATGRPFSGDDSGALLFATLHRYGFASQPFSDGPGDGLALHDCRVTNAVKCLPPENRPNGNEIARCAPFLAAELAGPSIVIALGGIAHRAVVGALQGRQRDYRFGHAARHTLPNGKWLIDCYHCSRYNLNTGRLTPTMFDQVFADARVVLSSRDADAS